MVVGCWLFGGFELYCSVTVPDYTVHANKKARNTSGLSKLYVVN
jgi:hypothetical protein